MIRWFGEETVIKIGIFGIFIGFVALPFAPSFPWMFITNTPIFFGLSMASPSINSLISRLAPSDEQGSVMGFNQGFASLSRVIGPLIAGIIFDIQITYPFILGAIIFGIVTTIAIAKIKPIVPYDANKIEIIS